MDTESTSDDRPRAWVDVDLGALVRNAHALILQARKPLIPMVKADAYGLGAVRAALALEAVHPMAFGVSSIAEGEELRAAGITRPVILFTPTVMSAAGDAWRCDDAARCIAAGITPTLARREDILAWERASGRAAYQLAIDTGMHRAGVAHELVDGLRAALAQFPPAGAFTHYHSAECDDGSLEVQEARFRAAVARLPARPPVLHAENSAAIARRPASAWDCVRPGVFLYGVGSGLTAALQPEPVAHLRARVLELRTVADGEGVSYGATWRAAGPRRIASVACGYADGLRRHLGNTSVALIGGARVPIAGVITMDMAMLDVTDVACEVGDVATFLGTSGGETLSAEAVAAAGGLSPYELLTGLRLRLPRFYTGAP
jgi:alanine racemase